MRYNMSTDVMLYMDREKANIPDMGENTSPREEAELLLE
jgi:hypothetical protein